MLLKKRNTCPLCDSGDISLFRKGTFDPEHIDTDDFKITDSRYGSLWTFFSCKKCGFVFSNPYVPEEGVIEFYTQLEDPEYSTEAEGRGKNFKTVFRRLKRLRQEGAGTAGLEGVGAADLIDIGAASGIFLDLARSEGYDIEGIEPSKSLCKDAKDRYDIDLFNGTVEEYPIKKKFSVVTLLDIIEHLVNPNTFMEAVNELLDDNGILVIVTPDVSSLAARLTGKRWWHYRIAHINFFNLRSLRYFLDKHGYEIILKKRYVWNFSVYYLATRVFPFLKGEKSLQKFLKRLNLILPLFDSWEIYARKKTNST